MLLRKSLSVLSIILIILLAQSCQTDGLIDSGGQTDEVKKFLGVWSVSDQPARLNYYVTIERDPVYANQVYLNNFADAGDKAIGLVVGDKIVIDRQNVGNGYSSTGEGQYINSKNLKFEFLLDDGIDSEARKASFAK